MNNVIVGILIPVAVGVIASTIVALLKRAKTYILGYRIGSWLRAKGLGYDLPVVGGEQEESVKEAVLATVSDLFRGLARGIAGKPVAEEQ